MHLELHVAPELRMQPSAAMVAYAQVLMLSSAELEEHVEEAVASNPALVRLQSEDDCRRCGVEPADVGCARCGQGAAHGGWNPPGAAAPNHDAYALDPPSPAADARLTLAVPEHQRAVVAYLLDDVDGRGFLDVDLGSVAARLGVKDSVVQDALAKLRHAGPAGFGARTVRECLLLQLDRMEQAAEIPPLVRHIVDRHLAALAASQLAAIAEATGADVGEVAAAHDFIVEHLRPYAAFDGVGASGSACAAAVAPAWPDIVIHENGRDYDVETVERSRLRMGVDPLYRDIAAGRLGGVSGDQARQISGQVARARALLNRLEERWSTMQAVGEEAVSRQRDFLSQGPRHLRPLTRREVAEALGVHESTVSRATRLKHVRLPNGRLVPFGDFFPRSPGVREMLAELVEREPLALSDGELARRLAESGYAVARRTVAKYRAELGIRSIAVG